MYRVCSRNQAVWRLRVFCCEHAPGRADGACTPSSGGGAGDSVSRVTPGGHQGPWLSRRGMAQEPTCAAPARSTGSSTGKRTRSEPDGRAPQDETVVHESRFGGVVGRPRPSAAERQREFLRCRSRATDAAAELIRQPEQKSSIRRRRGVNTSMVPADRLGRRLVVDTKTRADTLVGKPKGTEPSGLGGDALIPRGIRGRTERDLEPNPRVGAQSLRSGRPFSASCQGNANSGAGPSRRNTVRQQVRPSTTPQGHRRPAEPRRWPLRPTRRRRRPNLSPLQGLSRLEKQNRPFGAEEEVALGGQFGVRT